MKKLLLICSLLLCIGSGLFAQAEETGGPLVDIELQPVCDDGTTVFQVLRYVVGFPTPTLLGYVDAAGASYTLSGGNLTAGYCNGDNGTAGPDYTTAVMAMCDDGTAFYRIAVFTDNTSTPTTTADLELDLSTSYTTTGTVSTGPCAASVTATVSRSVSATTGSISAGAFSYEICNTGVEAGNVTVGAGPGAALTPGACTSYRAVYNPTNRTWRVAPAVSYDATGTLFAIVVEN